MLDINGNNVNNSDLSEAVLKYYEGVLGFKPTKSQVRVLRDTFDGCGGTNNTDGLYKMLFEVETDADLRAMLMSNPILITNQSKNITCNKTDP